MRFAAYHVLGVGVLMIAQWAFFLAAGQAPELATAPLQTGFHLAAEAGTAVALITTGVGLLQRSRWGRPLALLALGMLIYTLIQSPGYFAQQQARPLVFMFVVLLALALFSLWRLWQYPVAVGEKA